MQITSVCPWNIAHATFSSLAITQPRVCEHVMEGVCACVKVVRRGRMTRTDTHTLAGFNMFRTSIVASDVQREQGYTHTVLETASKGDLPQEARTGFNLTGCLGRGVHTILWSFG